MSTAAGDALDVLQRIRRRSAEERPRPGERCDLCREPIPDEHDHVVHLEHRSLLCTCRGCWLLFTAEGAGGGRYRAVPDRYAAVPDFTLAVAAWDAFQIPVSVAFFFHNSTLDRVAAFYPSPAGATESLLDLAAWDGLVAANPAVGTLAPDTEALLVRVGGPVAGGPAAGGPAVGGPVATDPAAYLVPIDACYELVGLMRLHWRGFDGGQEARQALDRFFADVAGRSR